VAVTGTFSRRSPHGEQNSDGLLVFRTLAHVTPGAAPGAERITTPSSSAFPDVPAPPRPSPRAAVSTQRRNESIEHYERCNQLLIEHRFAQAASECQRALDRWSGNHLAWYALGNIHGTQGDWCAARDAYAHAVQLRPDAAMYQLYDGIASYQIGARSAALDDRSSARCPSDALVSSWLADQRTVATQLFRPYLIAAARSEPTDTAPAALAHARAALSITARLAPQLWQASYYLGKAALQQELPRVAAEAFGQSIRAEPSQAEPYIALIQLYRSWDFVDPSFLVARQAAHEATTGDLARLFYEVGMAYEAKNANVAAVAAFSSAVAGHNAPARFQRGQLYLRQGELAKAKLDLEAFLADNDPALGFARQIARTLLLSIARKTLEDDAYLRMPRHYENQ
jgi:tetratricopeptide (TPR) repeat protein